MTVVRGVLAAVLLTLAGFTTAACDEGGIGMGVPSTGARWGGAGAPGPGVLVGGGPVMR